MRHVQLLLMSVVLAVLFGCSGSSESNGFKSGTTSTTGVGGHAGQGGQGGDGGSAGGTSDGGGGAGGNSSTGGGGSGGAPVVEFFSCTDVVAKHFVAKIRADAVLDGHAIRLGGWIDYTDGSGFADVGCFMLTGPTGNEEVAFDFGEQPTASRYELYPGSTSDPGGNPACPGIPNGSYYCPNSQPYACTVDILGCYGAQEIGRYVDGQASGDFAFAPNNPNPVFKTP